MEDFGEYTPLDAHVGRRHAPGPQLHNLYPTHLPLRRVRLRARAAAPGRALQPLRLDRRRAAARQVVWGGDPTTDWGFDGLRSA